MRHTRRTLRRCPPQYRPISKRARELGELLFGLDFGPLDIITPDLDILIGASALRHNVTLLTNNRRDFEHIEGLTIESV